MATFVQGNGQVHRWLAFCRYGLPFSTLKLRLLLKADCSPNALSHASFQRWYCFLFLYSNSLTKQIILVKLLLYEPKASLVRLGYLDGVLIWSTWPWVLEGRQMLQECERANNVGEDGLSGLAQAMGKLEIPEDGHRLASEGNCNILVTSGTLIPSLVKCLLFRLDPYFHPSNSKSPSFV